MITLSVTSSRSRWGSSPLCCSAERTDRKSTRLNSSHSQISHAVFCLKKKTLAFPPDDQEERTPHCSESPLDARLVQPTPFDSGSSSSSSLLRDYAVRPHSTVTSPCAS